VAAAIGYYGTGPRKAMAAPGHARRVLVVDDNEDAAEMLGAALRHIGHEVVIVHDGAQALAALERFEPQAAVLDIGLPVMDGYELARRLRENVRSCLLIALTGYGQETDRARSAAAGFDTHLVKPVDLQELASMIEVS
jgi:CheY-like chemotaxis protein